jgi:hypothetical protein
LFGSANQTESAIMTLQSYIEKKNKLKEAGSALILHKDERILYAQSSDFLEERAVRDYAGSGHSFRITKGWWYRVSSGQSESHGELRKIDSGILYITSKRIIFSGTFKNYSYNCNKLVSFAPFSNAITIGIEGRQKTLTFTSKNPVLLIVSVLMLQAKMKIDEEMKDNVENAAKAGLWEDSASAEEARPYLENELKTKIALNIKAIEGELKITIENYEDMAQIFKSLSDCIQLDIEEYTTILNKIPTEVKVLKSKVDAVAKILAAFDKELKKIKVKMGSSANKEELQAEFDKVVDKKYGDSAIADVMQDFTEALTSLSLEGMMITVKHETEKK